MAESPDLNSKRKKYRTIQWLSYLFLGITLVAGYFFVGKMLEYNRGKIAYAKVSESVLSPAGGSGMLETYLSQQVIIPQSDGGAGQVTSIVEPSSPNTEQGAPLPIPITAEELDFQRVSSLISIDFEKLKTLYPDAIGWIFSENTNISFPLMHGGDNYFYLNHLPDRTANKLGSIFLDYRSSPKLDDEIVPIYGHNMNDGSMFASLQNYKKQAYYDEHPSIYLFLPDKVLRVDLFAGNIIDPYDSVLLRREFTGAQDKQNFIDTAIVGSTFKSPVKVTTEDRMVIFYTCTYEFSDARYMLVGKTVQLWPPLNPAH